MELFYIIILLAIFAETSFLCVKNNEKNASKSGRRKVFVDTSALMDGRILNVAQTGFISDDLIIPRSVIREMQLLADGKDSEKRTRARAGMDVVNELERVVFFNTTILQDELDKTPVDERLLALAKENNGLILTCDYNLMKVAATEKIETLNINDLALSIRSEYATGDKLFIKVVAEGSNKNQGVGYLPDGTMVVVDNAGKKINETVEVEIIRNLQTSAGKMIFAKLVRISSEEANHRKSRDGRLTESWSRKQMRSRRQSR